MKKENKRQNKSFSPKSNLWLSVKSDIELKIITGEYAVGDKIPTIVELIEKYGIGKTTAQKVINDLYSEGVIVKKVGVGCFVKPFVKEKLFATHEEELKTLIDKAVDYALQLGVDRKRIIDIVNACIDER